MLILVLILIMVTVMAVVMVTGITDGVSENLANFYSSEAIGKFNAYVNQELILARKASLSSRIVEWFADEEDPAKKTAAYDEIIDYTSILQKASVYLGIHKSLNEYYAFGNKTSFSDFSIVGRLDPSDTMNDWYFNCVKSSQDYTFNVDIDKATHERHIWINYKVMEGSELKGVFCFGIPFDEMARNLFAQYDNENVKGYIVDRSGLIQMDSTLSDLHFEEKTNKNRIHTFYTNPLFHSAIDTYLDNIEGYFDPSVQPIMIKLDKDFFKYVLIAPITGTDWSVVTFLNNRSLFGITTLLPLLITMLSAFLIYVLADNFFIHLLVFTPLHRLTKSLTASNFYISEIFGCERNDEIGVLAQTIQKMRDRLSTYNAELLRAARERERLIRIDQLTDIPNRRSFDERLPLEWGRAIRTKTPISLLILDLDYFKNYNDTYGHLQGDKALQVVAKLFMQELKRSGDLVARWGGEEFAILLSNTDVTGALDVAERIRQRVEGSQIPLIDGSASKMTISAGVNSLIPTSSSSLEDFLHHADMALYTAKREGRNRVCLYKGVQIQ
jgi:diguanylate cyclase (GGDEF)-like protein